MLKIFKKISSRTSILDDMDFYEIREKELLMKRSSKSGAKRAELYAKANQSVSSALVFFSSPLLF